MPVPTKVKIGPVIFDVQIAPGKELREANRDNPPNGLVLYTDAYIGVSEDVHPQLRAAALWHEIIHAILYQGGHAEHSEDFVLGMGYGIMQMIRENPELVAYTLETKP